ncbi:MAG: PAS domain S-box protein [Mojavia pulchra JT2-VF2]|jgi:PAS domain S-box-containing protein|uniref:histidine kinase n=1 Tax=Mojavia pulchra JT2-VF2 TaxID=287848 RepID=A0A951UG61_9NOST|nr:PAS domain S-box protein [Mojavia pulchra JT2-VF2]
MLKVNCLRLQVQQSIASLSLIVQATSAFTGGVGGAIAILVGGLVLIGWSLDIEFLKNGFDTSVVTMKANTALCFLLSGVSLLLIERGRKRKDEAKTYLNSAFYLWLSRMCAVGVSIIGSLTLGQYLFGWNLGIDELLFRDSPNAVLTSHPGRMGLNTALSFMLVGRSLELAGHQKTKRSYWYAQILTLIAALISLQALIGYAYQSKVFYGIQPYTTSMALHTALTFTVLSIGIVCTHPHKGLMQVVMSNNYGGLLARRLLLAAILVPFTLGWLIVQGQRAGKYDTAFAISLFAIAVILIFAILIWHSAAHIDHLSHQRDSIQDALKAYEEKLRSFVDANVIGILFGDVDGGIQEANEEFLRMIGYTREDLLAGRISWKNVTPPEYLYLDEQGINEAKANTNGACTPYEKEYIRKDGSRILVLVGYVLLGEKREESVAFILDLSERKQAKQQILQLNKDLQRRISELQTLLDVIPIGIGIAEDPECQTIRVNPHFAKQLGISPDMNASLTTSIEERPKFKLYRKGRELAGNELPMQYSAANGVEVLDFEVDVVQENGKMVKLLEYVTPLFDEEGKTRGCIGAFLDITERKQAEEILLNQQKWLEEVLNLMPRPLLFIEPETARVTFANRSANELAGGEFPKGITAEEYHQFYYYTDLNGDRIPNEQMPGVRVARGERLDGLEVDWHTSQGIRSLLIFADTMPAMHGYPATCILVFQEVTNLKQVEKALSLGYKRLQLLFDTASELLSSQHPVALIASLYGKLSEQIGLDVYLNYLVEPNSQLMHLDSSTGIPEELATEIEYLEIGEAVCGTVAQTRCAIAVENVQQSTDPKTELIRSLGITAYYCYPLIAQGQLLGTLSFGSRTRTRFTDNQKGMMQAVCDQIAIAMERAKLIASLQQQTEQLQEANRMKDEFLAILSHELRSPLNAILGWAQLLRSRNLSETQTHKGLETIERNAKAQTQLIEDLLDISRMIRGKLRLNVRTCNVIPIIESALETVSLAAQVKEIDVKFSYPGWESPTANLALGINSGNPESTVVTTSLFDVPHHSNLNDAKELNSEFLVSGDAERLQQIIWNLLSNAIKFTPQGGRVEIRLSKNGGEQQKLKGDITSYAQIQVIDTGIGINPEFLPYVFDRFCQADSSSTRAHGGLGLGLAIVRHLVELHGGTVHVDSQGEQQGATFTVKLPLIVPDQAIVSQPQSQEEDSASLYPNLKGVRVLVVDDEADSREFIATVLHQCQAEVQAVESVQEALRLILTWKPNVLVSDIGMPQEDGYSLIRKLRSQPPEQGGTIPAAALTAYARAEDRMRAIQEGYQLHLPKPIEAAELATVVASLVSRT